MYHTLLTVIGEHLKTKRFHNENVSIMKTLRKLIQHSIIKPSVEAGPPCCAGVAVCIRGFGLVLDEISPCPVTICGSGQRRSKKSD